MISSPVLKFKGENHASLASCVKAPLYPSEGTGQDPSMFSLFTHSDFRSVDFLAVTGHPSTQVHIHERLSMGLKS